MIEIIAIGYKGYITGFVYTCNNTNYFMATSSAVMNELLINTRKKVCMEDLANFL